MSRCAECGQPVHPHQLTCGSCGAPLRPEEGTAATASSSPETDDPEKPDEAEAFSLDEAFELREEAAPAPAAGASAGTRRGRPARRPRARVRGPVSSKAFLSRAWAFVVDAMLLTVASAALPTIAGIGIRAAEAVSGTTELYDDRIIEELTTIGQVALVASYFVFMTAGAGQTLGKGLMNLHVVRVDGRPPDLLQSLIRFVGYVFSALPFGFGFLLAAFSPRRALHDYLAGTVVVRPRDMPPVESEDGAA